MNGRRIATILIPLVVLALLACETTTMTLAPEGASADLTTPSSQLPEQSAYAAAQATLAYGQSEMIELSHQATVVSLNMAQAANVAAQSTRDHHQRQLMELSIQSTMVSQNMAQAAATQEFIVEQTRTAWNATATAESSAATATAESSAATATYSAYVLNATQTAQAQAAMDIHATQTAQANATQTAYPLTATPWAAIQADIARTRDEAARRAIWGEFVVTPVKFILSTLIVLLLIVGGVLAYQRLMPVLELRLRTIAHGDGNGGPLLLLDGRIVDSNHRLTQQGLRLLNPRQLPGDNAVQVEIIDPSEPSVINWITEAEQKLRSAGGIQL